MEEAVTPLPIPERTPPVTTTILRSALRVSVRRWDSLGGRLSSLSDGRVVMVEDCGEANAFADWSKRRSNNANDDRWQRWVVILPLTAMTRFVLSVILIN